MKKKIIVLVLVIISLISLTSCGGSVNSVRNNIYLKQAIDSFEDFGDDDAFILYNDEYAMNICKKGNYYSIYTNKKNDTQAELENAYNLYYDTFDDAVSGISSRYGLKNTAYVLLSDYLDDIKLALRSVDKPTIYYYMGIGYSFSVEASYLSDLFYGVALAYGLDATLPDMITLKVDRDFVNILPSVSFNTYYVYVEYGQILIGYF